MTNSNAGKVEQSPIDSTTMSEDNSQNSLLDDIKVEESFEDPEMPLAFVNIRQLSNDTDKCDVNQPTNDRKDSKRTKRKSALVCLKKFKTNNFDLTNVSFADDESSQSDFDRMEMQIELSKQSRFVKENNNLKEGFELKVEKVQTEQKNGEKNSIDRMIARAADKNYNDQEHVLISSDEDIGGLELNDWKCEFSIDSRDTDDQPSALEDDNGSKAISSQKPRRVMPPKEKTKCPHCHQLFEVLVTHIRTCTARSDYICKFCYKAMESASELKKHTDKMHSDGLPACYICFASFESLHKRSEHVRREHRESKFSCEKCGRTFTKKIMLQEHNERRHSEIINKECTKCKKKLKTEFLYRRHLKQHEIEDRLKCQFCGKMFTRMQFRLNHERIHTGERPYLCEMCGLGFATLIDVKFHIKSVHFPDKYKKAFQTRKRYPYKPRPASEQVRFKCALCPREFGTSYGLDQHLRKHTENRKYVCEQCGNGFNRLVHLKQHERRMHLKLRQYKCDECGKEFFEKYEVTHHKLVHQVDRPLKCEHCPARFKQKKMLKAHLAKHSSEKPYVCNACGKAYKFSTNLQAHFQRHTDEEIKQVERKLLIDMEASIEANQIGNMSEENIVDDEETIMEEENFVEEEHIEEGEIEEIDFYVETEVDFDVENEI